MPNVDDHGLEVLKKAAINLDVILKKNYALQVIGVKNNGETFFTPVIVKKDLLVADTEYEIDIPDNYGFVLKQTKMSNAKMSFVSGGTSGTDFLSLNLGDGWVEKRKLNTNKIFVQSDENNNTIEIVVYT